VAGWSAVTWKPRIMDPGELDAAADLSAVMFHVGPTLPDADRSRMRMVLETDRTFVIDDGPALAGIAAAYSMAVVLPGGGSVPMAGVTEVGVLPTHRRRGMLRALMTAVHDQAIERGEPLAGLTASQGGIYRRFGYGVATRVQTMTVDCTRAEELVDTTIPGRLRLVDETEAAKVLPAVWEQHWRRRPGELARSPRWWEAMAVDSPEWRDGATARFVVAHEDPSGRVDGAAVYRLKDAEVAGGRWSELRVRDLIAVDDRVEAALLRYLLDVDLVGKLTWWGPVDLPLRWRLVDSRALSVSREVDMLWLRPFDVPACLTARSYAGPADGLVLEVVDAARPELGGRFLLEAGVDGASCRAVSSEPDVVLGAADLGSLLLGGVTWATLLRAGLIEERTPGAVTRLDGLFRPDRAPFCGTSF
jgi:predicted acetyltransferase